MTNQRQQQKIISTIEVGKLQPQAIEIEEAVLGALMLESNAYKDVEDKLSPDDFYLPCNKQIYTAIASLTSNRKPVDMLTVIEELKKMGELENIGGPIYIAELTGRVASSANIVYHSQIIKQKSLARKVIQLSNTIQQKAFDETNDIADVIEEMEKSLTDINLNISGCRAQSMDDALIEASKKAAQTQIDRQSGKLIAIPTGLFSLDDEFAGGWRAPDLIVIGARPSMGKTQHALSFAKAASKAGVDTLFVSIEMTASQLVYRYLLEDERISSHNLRTGQMTPEEWNSFDETRSRFSGMKLHIADNYNIKYLNNIKSEARRLLRRGQLKMIIIDYLQLINTNLKFSNRHLEIGYITKELKSLAKELNVPIILLSQLSRAEKGVKIREPQLDDLKESGEIENDADIVLFIHKPDYYDPLAADREKIPWKGRGKLIISKYREGARNQFVIFHHDDRYKKIFDRKQHKAVTDYSKKEENLPF